MSKEMTLTVAVALVIVALLLAVYQDPRKFYPPFFSNDPPHVRTSFEEDMRARFLSLPEVDMDEPMFLPAFHQRSS